MPSLLSWKYYLASIHLSIYLSILIIFSCMCLFLNSYVPRFLRSSRAQNPTKRRNQNTYLNLSDGYTTMKFIKASVCHSVNDINITYLPVKTYCQCHEIVLFYLSSQCGNAWLSFSLVYNIPPSLLHHIYKHVSSTCSRPIFAAPFL